MRNLGRIGAALAAMTVGLATLGIATAARADDEEQQASVRLSAAQVSAVTVARADYLKAAWQAKATYRLDDEKAKAAMDASLLTPRLNVLLAKDAYEVAARYGGDTTATKNAMNSSLGSYRTAYESALATAQAATNAARTSLNAALGTAKTAYVAAVTVAFPGSTAPRELLKPPGPGMGWFGDHDGWMGLLKEFGISRDFDMHWPKGMGWAWGNDMGHD